MKNTIESLERPTQYHEVNAIVQELLKGAKSILGDQLLGMYLHGSLASGDFSPETSDIDYVIVLSEKPDDDTISALRNLHEQLSDGNGKWAKKLEGTYIPQKEFRRYNPDDGPYPSTNEGEFYLAKHETHWVLARHLLRENGVIVYGPSPNDLIASVSANDIKQAILGFLNGWWFYVLDNPSRLESLEYQAYAALTMCRALYTLENGKIASKPVSAKWAQKAHTQWNDLITWALSWNQHTMSGKFEEARDFIRYTLQIANR
ncbi:MAG: DUF4111 domain-containing protein [Anaerolineales bacterium]|nr:DUF4111 domain-containing protein [Anaerolineales bacterium]